MFQFPPPGPLVDVGFNGGRPDKPFVRQTLAQGNSWPAAQGPNLAPSGSISVLHPSVELTAQSGH